jgi:Low psii accumulation1 / Rep27
MSEQNSQQSKSNPLRKTDPDKYAQLRAESMAPYRNLRLFVYAGFGASGFIGGIVFLTQILAGRNLETALPNFAVQAGVVALMATLFLWEQKRKTRLIEAWRDRIRREDNP